MERPLQYETDAMTHANDNSDDAAPKPARILTDTARRALAEAEERRKRAGTPQLAKEIGGRGGEDPARYGDWEIDGRAIDF